MSSAAGPPLLGPSPSDFCHNRPVADVIPVVQPAEEMAWPDSGFAAGAGFEAAFREHYPRIVAVLTRLTGDSAAAEEIASDVLCKLARRPRLADTDHLGAWLYRVAINAGLDAVRSTSRRRRREDRAGREGASADPGALNALLRQERCERVRSVLASLKPRDAELLLLRADGMAYRDLAAVIEVQPASVGSLLARAEAEFERKYRARFGDAV
jgi:RNA polymerase sigma-70 factor (ECF subfamily)